MRLEKATVGQCRAEWRRSGNQELTEGAARERETNKQNTGQRDAGKNWAAVVGRGESRSLHHRTCLGSHHFSLIGIQLLSR